MWKDVGFWLHRCDAMAAHSKHCGSINLNYCPLINWYKLEQNSFVHTYQWNTEQHQNLNYPFLNKGTIKHFWWNSHSYIQNLFFPPLCALTVLHCSPEASCLKLCTLARRWPGSGADMSLWEQRLSSSHVVPPIPHPSYLMPVGATENLR